MRLIEKILPGLLFFMLWSCSIHGPKDDAWNVVKDPQQPPGERAENLLSLMTTEEKVAQITTLDEASALTLFDDKGKFDPGKASKNFPYGFGYLCLPEQLEQKHSAGEIAELTNTIQKYFKRKTRLGIPLIFYETHTYGNTVKNGTCFPTQLGLASTWDPELVKSVHAIAASEIRSRGEHQVPAPDASSLIESNKIKIEDTFGTDTFLVSQMTREAVKGLQGNENFQRKKHVIATLNHFATPGKISTKLLDKMVMPILESKFKLGLFDDPFVDPDLTERITGKEEHRKLAFDAALKSITLLKNSHQTLPLKLGNTKSLIVITPGIDENTFTVNQKTGGIEEPFLKLIKSKTGGIVSVISNGVTQASTINNKNESTFIKTGSIFKNNGRVVKEHFIRKSMEEAKEADAVILLLDHSNLSCKNEKENFDLSLLPELLNKLKSIEKPVVIVLNNCNPNVISKLNNEADAVLECWLYGQEGGRALADVISGDYNPGGKLPFAIAESDGLSSVKCNFRSFTGISNSSEDPSLIYPIGYGLSYSAFNISEPKLSNDILEKDGCVNVEVRVKNAGSMIGDQVVQLYTKRLTSSGVDPVKKLKAFKRVTLNPREISTIDFKLSAKDFGCENDTIKTDKIIVMTGFDSKNVKEAVLTLR